MNRRFHAGFPIALFALILAHAAAAAESPVTARLEVLSTPTLGGTGQVIWAAIPNLTPQRAELVFILQAPGVPAKETLVPVVLAQGQLAERIYLFETMAAGSYKISARLRMVMGAGQVTYEDLQAITLRPEASKNGKPRREIALTLNGALVAGEINYPSEKKIFTYYQSKDMYLTYETIAGTLSNHDMEITVMDQYPLGTVAWCEGRQYSSKLMSRLSLDTKRRISINARDGQSTGTFFIHVTSGPWLKYVFINNNAPYTETRDVTLTCPNNGQNIPTEIMVSEFADFHDAIWKPYVANLPFTLSAGRGIKVVYLKGRNVLGIESATFSDDIYYSDARITSGVTALTDALTIRLDSNWLIFSVPVRARYSIETKTMSNGPASATLYGSSLKTPIAADAPVGSDPRTRLMTVDLSPGTYSVKVTAENLPCSYSIRVLLEGTVNSFFINNNKAETASRVVTLNNNVVGQPTFYMASNYSDFQDAEWLPYAAAPAFKLNAGNLKKTVYFKVKNADGRETEVRKDDIVLREVTPILADGSWHAGNINPASDADWFQFAVGSTGDYVIETRCGSLEDTVLALYGPQSKSVLVAQDDDSGENYAAKITKRLARGTYYAKVSAKFPTETGTYTIMVKRK